MKTLLKISIPGILLCNAVYAGPIITTVKHLTRVNILQSNNVSLRPGSIYDNMTYFESLLDWQPGFNYEFLDSGLGAAEPLYPMYQKGNQGSWFQLFPAMFDENWRHIDHYSSLDTPEGCRVDGIYLLRNIDEYPATQFVDERKQGYTLVVTRLEHYLRLRPDAQCGRHHANDPDPYFDPVKYMADNHDAMSLDDFFPQGDLKRFEAKLSVIYHVKEEMKPEWPIFDTEKFNRNSLWFYPEGHARDFGINTPRPQTPFLSAAPIARDFVIDPSDSIRDRFPLSSLVKAEQFNQILDFVTGRPFPDFDPRTEPGLDTLDLRQSNPTYAYTYTSGLEMEPIRDAIADISQPHHFKMVGMTVKPYEEQEDSSWNGTRIVPQIRFVYQLMDPKNLNRPLEQFYLHVKYDVVDRYSDRMTRDQDHFYFLQRVDELVAARDTADYDNTLATFIEEFTKSPVEAIAWSSSLTGIWVFGTLVKEQNSDHLTPMRNIRNGVDVGFYSTVYDNDLFRAEIANSSGDRKASLQKHMDDLTVSYFRDPKRHDPHSVNFNRVTCAQCHQTSGRDGVHMSFNDDIDRRITTRIRATEHMYLESDRQLINGQDYWKLRRYPSVRAE
jgi:hypothetical protein